MYNDFIKKKNLYEKEIIFHKIYEAIQSEAISVCARRLCWNQKLGYALEREVRAEFYTFLGISLFTPF